MWVGFHGLASLSEKSMPLFRRPPFCDVLWNIACLNVSCGIFRTPDMQAGGGQECLVCLGWARRMFREINVYFSELIGATGVC
ncbi:MAG: hypothetical protein BWY10_02502 [Chloroflexi bacterium ADurb.Bin180]|nr:MAG: hypothetical protein BWY10_02502 [Chloroflexi bacterium ADurb.Bin180]